MPRKKQHVTEVVVDTSKTVSQFGIQIPQINYKAIADVSMQIAFEGMVTPIPTVLIHHLTPNEFLFVAVIIEETIEKGECALTLMDIANRMGSNYNTAVYIKKRLQASGLINYEKRRLQPSIYSLNWETVNALDELMKDEPRAIMARVKKVTKKRKIKNLSKCDIEAAYTEKILPFNHDPREEEIYD